MDIYHLDKIDWESVVMEPMGPGEYTGTAVPDLIPNMDKRGNTYVKAIITAKLTRYAIKILFYVVVLTFILLGSGTFLGNVTPAEFTYHQLIGFMEIVLGLCLMMIIKRI